MKMKPTNEQVFIYDSDSVSLTKLVGLLEALDPNMPLTVGDLLDIVLNCPKQINP